jgi:hypothetical protein
MGGPDKPGRPLPQPQAGAGIMALTPLTYEEVLGKLGGAVKSIPGLLRMARMGTLPFPAHQIGRTWVFYQEDIERWRDWESNRFFANEGGSNNGSTQTAGRQRLVLSVEGERQNPKPDNWNKQPKRSRKNRSGEASAMDSVASRFAGETLDVAASHD